MEKRLFFECSYNGTNYSGWQKQPNAPTVQEEIERKLGLLFPDRKIDIVGCGRTDAGVHALSSFFHVDLPMKFEDEQLQFKLNNMLPQDIAIKRVIPVAEEAHARFDATVRTYQYLLHHNKDPFLQDISWFFPRPLSIAAMNEGGQYILGRQDFTSFSKLHTDVNNNFCEVFKIAWSQQGTQVQFEIKANRFLRNMVRAIVGTLVEVGLGNIPPEEVKHIIQAQDRNKAGFSVPAKGLYLKKVEYPFIGA